MFDEELNTLLALERLSRTFDEFYSKVKTKPIFVSRQ